MMVESTLLSVNQSRLREFNPTLAPIFFFHHHKSERGNGIYVSVGTAVLRNLFQSVSH